MNILLQKAFTFQSARQEHASYPSGSKAFISARRWNLTNNPLKTQRHDFMEVQEQVLGSVRRFSTGTTVNVWTSVGELGS